VLFAIAQGAVMTDEPDYEPGPNLTLLKWIVGILGFLIILFVGIIGVTLYMRITGSESANPPATAEESRPAPATVVEGSGLVPLSGFGDVAIQVPEDMDVISLTSDGARMFLTLGTEGTARRILVYSLADGRELGRFILDRAIVQ
jgi:hypothetical protein|tara:strand:- start:8349 stop:8783 length:435 start_codon:yes stop_codon:yes gene_type:complete